jgi:hypothetical protein
MHAELAAWENCELCWALNNPEQAEAEAIFNKRREERAQLEAEIAAGRRAREIAAAAIGAKQVREALKEKEKKQKEQQKELEEYEAYQRRLVEQAIRAAANAWRPTRAAVQADWGYNKPTFDVFNDFTLESEWLQAARANIESECETIDEWSDLVGEAAKGMGAYWVGRH